MADTQAVDTGLYTLTPTHVGTGRAADAVDLPVMREEHTRHPLLPSTALKGVMRDHFERAMGRDSGQVKKLFGPPPPKRNESSEALERGDLIFTDAHLLAFPVRSLSAAFYWVTCPLVIERWRRLRRVWSLAVVGPVPEGRVTATFAHPGALVLEDHVLGADALASGPNPELKVVAEVWGKLLPADDGIAQKLVDRLVCLRDTDFSHLVQRCTSVQARIQLTEGKTTDKWRDEQGKEHEGNLWYEESLPPDCLFSALIAGRNGTAAQVVTQLGEPGTRVQIGGNESVGQGICWWRPTKGKS